MKDKEKDKKYCNVREDIIKKANPFLNQVNLKHLYEWIVERYKIHLKKDVQKLNPPWTSNNMLQNYRFTNVRREHDKETRWLINNISKSELSYENKILNSVLFRLFSKSETIKIFGLIDFNNFDINSIKNKIQKFSSENQNYLFFSNAFFTSGQKNAANKLFPDEESMTTKIILMVNNYKRERILNKINSAENQKEVFDALLSLQGIGDFLAYQIFVDLCYINDFPFSENEFVIAGPGCKKGLNMIFENFDGMNYEEALFWLRDNQHEIFKKFGYSPDELFSDLPSEERYLNLMSLENCMCELSKYIRAINGTGRPRIRYKYPTN